MLVVLLVFTFTIYKLILNIKASWDCACIINIKFLVTTPHFFFEILFNEAFDANDLPIIIHTQLHVPLHFMIMKFSRVQFSQNKFTQPYTNATKQGAIITMNSMTCTAACSIAHCQLSDFQFFVHVISTDHIVWSYETLMPFLLRFCKQSDSSARVHSAHMREVRFWLAHPQN